MADLKLFRLANGGVSEVAGTTETVEKSLQTLFEKNLEALLGVRFLASSGRAISSSGNAPRSSTPCVGTSASTA
jgi:hypothetical protein